VLVVCLNYHLHQVVTHNVFFGEIDKLDAFEVADDALRFNQPGATACGQIDLRYVSRDDCL
jgi:hypothetical protein